MSVVAQLGEPAPPSLLDALPPHIVTFVFSTALRLHADGLKQLADEDTFEARRRDPRRVLPLVSRGFLAAVADADCLWHRVQLNLLTLTVDRVPRFARWLAAHAPALRCLVLHGRALPTVETALHAHADALAAAVQRASGLERLELPRTLGAALLSRLSPQGLPRLRTVGVELAASHSASGSVSQGGGGSSGGSVQGTARGRRLSEVEQAAANLLLLPALSELLVQSRLEASLLAAYPTASRQLQRLHFADVRDVPGGPALASLACLTSLTSLRFYQRDGFSLPGPLTALLRLSHLHAAVRYQDDPLLVAHSISSITTLEALWLQHAAFDVPASLAALPRLHSLGLVASSGSWAAVLEALAAAPQQGAGAVNAAPAVAAAPLQAARAAAAAAASEAAPLQAAAAAAAGVAAATAAPALLPASPPTLKQSGARLQGRLRALHLEAHAQSVAEVPAEVWEALPLLGDALTRLELPFNRLRELPEGLCLDNVQVLDLSQNSLSCIPPALEACTQLSALSFTQQEAAALGDSAADVTVLCALPALRLLASSAGHYSAPHLAAGLRSPAEAAHLARLRAALPPRVRVTNRQGEWERGAGRLAALFEVSLRQGRL